MKRKHSTDRRGFTIVEILVVIGIIAVLASISLVALNKARKAADKSRLGFQLQGIAVGLQAYETDFNSLPLTATGLGPPSTTAANYYIDQEGVRGARMLCKALMGQCGGMNPLSKTPNTPFPAGQHQDGKVGLGFAVVGRSGIAVTADDLGNLKGKTYGPYLAVDKYPISNTQIDSATGVVTLTKSSLNNLEQYDDTAVLLDGNDTPILYWPCPNPQAPINVPYAYVSQGRTPAGTATITKATDSMEPVVAGAFAGTSMYSGLDNSSFIAAPLLCKLLGDKGDPAASGTKGDRKITGSEAAAVRGKYILWSSGPDGVFGPQTKNGTIPIDDAIKRPDLYDDVTNFQGE